MNVKDRSNSVVLITGAGIGPVTAILPGAVNTPITRTSIARGADAGGRGDSDA